MGKQIDLSTYRSVGSRVFAGRDRGDFVRQRECLAEMDRDLDPELTVQVVVPGDTISVNSSFFLGLFGDSIRALGEEGFRRRFIFTGHPIGRVYESGIREALTTVSALTAAAQVR